MKIKIRYPATKRIRRASYWTFLAVATPTALELARIWVTGLNIAINYCGGTFK